VINEMRAKWIMDLPLDHIPNEQFARVRSEKRDKGILGPMPASDAVRTSANSTSKSGK